MSAIEAQPDGVQVDQSGHAELKVSEAYNDPTADVMIVSNDDVHFKIQSFYLKAFRYM